MKHVVSISPAGVARSMHNDAFPLSFLGEQEITRASEIIWNKDNQSWDIWFILGGDAVEPAREYSGFESYEAARDFEVQVMNRCAEMDVKPYDPNALIWARRHR